ncbi:Protein vip1 [Vanrija pseudolonga]|uniref:Protein vip1 n=1 Tax=Vanrija pseudolonga TaxID=143232 RepID=A0AAF0YF55_9TREE|nr:Protein vip1 [Vanrija pseudolonga]
MSTGYTIHVSGLSATTDETKLADFFSFCGKLTSVKKSGTEADITFEKLSAQKTALMLNGGTLDGAHLEVTSTTPEGETAKNVLPTGGQTPTGATPTFDQEDKPKAAIAAEYLAHGYLLGDHIIQKAIEVDNKQGISTRFLSFINHIDKRAGERLVGENQTVSGNVHAQASQVYSKVREADQQRGVSTKFHEYYTKAIATPVGQRVSQFYTETSKQVLDVHEEAKRIANQKKGASRTTSPPPPPSAADAKAAEAGASAPAPAPAPAPAAAAAAAPAEPEKAAAAAATAPKS